MIIGISGKIGSGKDTIGKIIQELVLKHSNNEIIHSIDNKSGTKEQLEDSNWQIKKFADKLKDIVCLLIGCTREQLEDETFKNKELGEDWFKTIWWIKSNHNNLEKFYSKEEAEEFLSHWQENYLQNVYIASEDIMLTPRLLLQLLGTECGRQIIHPNIWVNALMSEYKTKVVPNENYGSNKTKPKSWVITKEEEHEYLLDNSHWVYKDEVNVISPNWIITDMRFPNELEAVKKRSGISIRVNKFKTLSEKLYNEAKTESYQLVEIDFNEHPSETALDNAEFDYTIENNGTLLELVEEVRKILTKEKII